MIARIAEDLLRGTPSSERIRQLGAGVSLPSWSVWADCARNVNPDLAYAYQIRSPHSICAQFEDKEGQQALRDYVQRFDKACALTTKAKACHKHAHFADVPYQAGQYKNTQLGASEGDIVHAILAAVSVLRGEKVKPPFQLLQQKEALALLVHLLGDVHQPLHLGAVYLDEAGQVKVPTAPLAHGIFSTFGGNQLRFGAGAQDDLHSLWDTAPRLDFAALQVRARSLFAAGVSPSEAHMSLEQKSQLWAQESILSAQKIYAPLHFSPMEKQEHGAIWNFVLDPKDAAQRQHIQEQAILHAGVRLALLLRVIFESAAQVKPS